MSIAMPSRHSPASNGDRRPLRLTLQNSSSDWRPRQDSNLRMAQVRNLALSPLSYGAVLRSQLAPCTGIEPVSTARQAAGLARCLAGQKLVDQVGLEPTKHTRRLKRPLPLPLGALVLACAIRDAGRSAAPAVENPGGYDPLAHGLKGRSLSIRVNAPGPENWCQRVESNHLPLGYRPRPSPFGFAGL